MKKPTETDLVMACLTLLQLRGCVAWRQNSGAFAVGQGRGRRFVRSVRGESGVSDIIACLPGGTFLACECKLPGGRPTDAQADYLMRVNMLGGHGVVINDVRELETFLDELGV